MSHYTGLGQEILLELNLNILIRDENPLFWNHVHPILREISYGYTG